MKRLLVTWATVSLSLVSALAATETAEVVVVHQRDVASAMSLECPGARFTISGDALRDAR